MSDIEQKPPMDPEQAAELAALTAAATEAGPAPGQPGAPAAEVQAGPPLEQEIASMLKMVAGMVRPALPSVAELYTDQVCDTIGATIGAVCKKHGWLQGGIGGKYGEEIMCLVVVGPIAWATVEAAKTDLAAHKAKKPGAPAKLDAPAAPAGQYQEPGQKTVTFGAPAT